MNFHHWIAVLFIIPIACPALAGPPVTALAFTPAGEEILAASQAGIEIFSWPKLLPAGKVPCTVNQIHDLAFSPDGKMLLVAGGSPAEEGSVEILSWPGAKQHLKFQPHKDVVYSCAWDSEGKQFASAAGDGICKLFDLTGKETGHYAGHSRSVLAISFLNKGGIVSASADATIQLWNTNGKTTKVLDNHLKAVTGFVLLPWEGNHGQEILTFGEDRTVRLWQIDTGRMVRFVKIKSVPRVAVMKGNMVFIGCDSGKVLALEKEGLKELWEKEVLPGRVFALAIPKTGAILAVGGVGGIKALPLP